MEGIEISTSHTSPDRSIVGDWVDIREDDVAEVNRDLRPGVPTVDVAMYYPSNLDPRHHEKVDVDLLLDGFVAAKEIFATADVQLRLTALRTGQLDPSYFVVRSSARGSDVPMGSYTNMYVEAERHPAILTDRAVELFTAVIGSPPNADRTVHVVALQGVFMDHFDPIVPARVYQRQTIETSGLSFPGYMHGGTIPRAVRGVITITNLRRTEDSWKTVAHELGHKLLNVSHEHREVSPAHEIHSDDGLMLYGKGTEIASGPDGRFHRERLHRSPFLYTESDDGAREYNPDYAAGGFYYDPIYDGATVDFETPATDA